MGGVPETAVRSDCGKYWFDEATANAAVRFFEDHLRLTKGEWAGRPFKLEPWQANSIIRPAFGWKRPDGTRRYRRIVVWVPRKNGKTEIAAGVSLIALVADGEAGAEVYAIAKDKDQASIVFNSAALMAANSATLSPSLELLKTAIYCPELGSSFKPLTGRAAGKHGLNPHGIIGDEVHEWPDADLYTFVHQGTAARRQPIEFLISTAGVRQGYGWELWQECQQILNGERQDDETLVVIFAAEADDDWTDPKVWAKANPNLGISVKLEYLQTECERAQESPRLENDFRRYHLNQWTEQLVRWLPMEKWGPVGEDWAEAAFEDEMVGQTAFGGLDLSTTTDLTAWCIWFPPSGERTRWRKLTRVFMPADSVNIAEKRDRAPYSQWLRSGALLTTPGNVVDYDFIAAQVRRDCERFEIERIGLDPFNATQFALGMQAEGIPIEFVRQGFLSLNAPSKELEKLVLSEAIEHGGHPVARWCAGNAVVVTDPAGSIKPTKDPKRMTGRIDAIAADVNALAVWMDTQFGTAVSPWDDPDFSLVAQ
jgi:phage terminase large subunit-like protein